MKKKTVKRVSKVVKNRNGGTMTEAAFWTFIRNVLRRKSMTWKPNALCRLIARRPYKGPNKRQSYEFQCNVCKNWFKGTEISVDHINPVGSLKEAKDLPYFVETLFCEIDNLQCICETCHHAKTIEDLKTIRK